MKKRPTAAGGPTGQALLIPPQRGVPVGTRARWRWHEKTLLGLRHRLVLRQLWELERGLRAPESGEDVEARLDFVVSLLDQEPDALGEINAALDRIRFDCYGYCETTGEPIPRARLRATPWLRRLRSVPVNRVPAAVLPGAR